MTEVVPDRTADQISRTPGPVERGEGITNLARAAMFTSLAVGSGYALLLIPNVELITAIIFVSGVYLGPRRGLMVGMVAEFIFSAANPLGSGIVFPPLLVAQVAGMGLVGLTGGLFKRILNVEDYSLATRVYLGATGGFLTFIFDSITTLAYPVSAGFEARQTAAIWVAGIGFTFLHQVSNSIIFFTALPRVFSRIE